VHGHYDAKTSNDGPATVKEKDDDLSVDRVNMGIAIVVPFHRINAVITAFESTPS
jgi:hypothetical protein